MSVDVDTPSRFEIGRVMQRTFGVLSRDLPTLLILAVLFEAAPAVIMGLLPDRAGGFGVADLALGLVGLFLKYALTFILQAALVQVTILDLNGRKASVRDSVAAGLRYALPVFLIAVLTGAGILLGFFFFIIPGIILAVGWSVAVPVAVIEGRGAFGSIGRSAELTRGHRWAVFGLVLIYVLLSWLVMGPIMAAAGLFAFGGVPGVHPVMVVITEALGGAVTGVVGAVGVTVLYFELRNVKEGVPPDAMAAVFD